MKNRHAVVIGGSVGGLMAARTLATHFQRVTLLERDVFPGATTLRKGIGQGAHVHVLLLGGLKAMESLFPGLRAELLDEGAVPIEVDRELDWLTPAGWAPSNASGVVMVTFSRELLDHVLLRRLRRLPNVEIRDGVEVSEPETLDADLIVDATGRASRLPLWLKRLGYPAPAEIRVNARLGYASRYYEGVSLPRKGLFVQMNPPDSIRAGVLFPVQGGRWLASLAGGNGDYPPADEADFLEFARTLPTPRFHEAIRNAKPVSPVRVYRATENRWRQYHRLDRHPPHLIAIGDAMCAFNPVYAQGMTVAAQCAQALDRCLRDGFEGLPGRYYAKAARVVSTSWLLATGEDSRFPDAEGVHRSVPMRWMQTYVERVVATSLSDRAVRRQWLEVFQMLRSPAALFTPPVLWHVLRHRKPSPQAYAGQSVGSN
jgi:flavin-dependent dehydrogenase